MPRFDVFLSHSNADKPAVEAIARRLRELDVRPWVDRWEMVGGRTWQEEVESALADSACCAVFVGPGGFGSVHEEEMRIAIEQQIALGKLGDEYRVIPVLLPGGSASSVPAFLARRSWVTFPALDDETALRTLLHAVRGTPPGPDAKAPCSRPRVCRWEATRTLRRRRSSCDRWSTASRLIRGSFI